MDESIHIQEEKTVDRITCERCGFVGRSEEFMELDNEDAICPRCGEDTDLIFDI